MIMIKASGACAMLRGERFAFALLCSRSNRMTVMKEPYRITRARPTTPALNLNN